MASRRTHWAGTSTSSTLALLLLSVLWAGAWLHASLISPLRADSPPPAVGQAVLFFVFALLAASIAVARRAEFPRGRHIWACAGIGIGLFVVPAALAALAQDSVSKLDRVAVFSLTPIFAIVLEPYLQGDTPRQAKAALAAALAAVAGILLLFPLDVPYSFGAAAALCVLVAASFCVGATNCFAVGLAHNLAGRSILPMAALAGAVGAICFAVAAAVPPNSPWTWNALLAELLWLLLFDLPALFLLFWLMRRLAASRMTARFLFAPLFAILADLAFEPSTPPGRGWLGMVLLTCGAAWLAFAPAQHSEIEQWTSLPAPPPEH